MKIHDDLKGTTQVFGIMGNPVGHSFSPILQTTLAKESGIDAAYIPFKVENENVKSAVLGAFALNIKGINVTVPHKKNVMDSLVEIDETAKKIGAVNTLKRVEKGYKGFNTDIIGLEKCLLLNGIEVKGRNVVILGAGGAANSALVLAAEKRAKNIYIVNRTKANAEELKSIIEKDFDGGIYILEFDDIMSIENPEIVIQTTSVGMGEGNTLTPVENGEFFKKVKAAVDVIYTPWETKFLSQAKEKGCIAVNGFDMLVYQGIASFEIWNDVVVSNAKAIEFRNMFSEYYNQ